MTDSHPHDADLQRAVESVLSRDLTAETRLVDNAVQLPPVPADGEVMVVRSLRLSTDLDRRIKAAAAKRGVAPSTLIREWVELALAEIENDQPISRADVLRAIASLRPVSDNAA